MEQYSGLIEITTYSEPNSFACASIASAVRFMLRTYPSVEPTSELPKWPPALGVKKRPATLLIPASASCFLKLSAPPYLAWSCTGEKGSQERTFGMALKGISMASKPPAPTSLNSSSQ